MPVYTLTAETAKLFPGFGMVNPGDSPVVTDKFLYPVPTGFELTDEGPAPWVTEHADVIGSGISLTELAKYKQLEITNASDAVIEFVANGDESHPKAIPNAILYPLNLDNDVWSLKITGAGAGNVYVSGNLK